MLSRSIVETTELAYKIYREGELCYQHCPVVAAKRFEHARSHPDPQCDGRPRQDGEDDGDSQNLVPLAVTHGRLKFVSFRKTRRRRVPEDCLLVCRKGLLATFVYSPRPRALPKPCKHTHLETAVVEYKQREWGD